MKLRLRLHLDADPDAVARAYADPALYAAFTDLPRAGRPAVLTYEVDGDIVRLRVRWAFTAPLSATARAVIDPDRLTWIDESTHDLARRTVTFRMVADHYADRFSCQGTYRFEPDDGRGTLRVIDGDLRVRAPLVAGQVERAIVSGLEEQLAGEVPLVERFLGA